MTAQRWHAEWAWLGGDRSDGVEADVLIEAEGATITTVEPGVRPAPADATRLAGLTLPGLVNAHSHAFHRALRGRAQSARAGDFWAWRKQMYAVAARLDPDSYYRLARAAFAEMALAGVTAFGEFHYLHHDVDGVPYADPNGMAEALRAAAAAAGVRITLLDALYLYGGFGEEPLDPVQRRFSDGDVDRWAARVESLRTDWADDPTAQVGVAVHSVRAVDPVAAKAVAELANSAFSPPKVASGRDLRGQERRVLPLHVHVSEQVAENHGCRSAHGASPTRVLADAGVLGPGSTAVHATHVGDDDLELLDRTGCTVCLCPTTERDLADGIGPARALAGRGVPVALGTDSHAVVDLFEETRLLELHGRLVSGRRGGLRPAWLLAAATSGGARSLGWPSAGQLAPGRLADFVTITTNSVRLAGTPSSDLLAVAVFAATAADVTDVVVGGRAVVQAGRHVLVDDVPGELAAAIEALEE